MRFILPTLVVLTLFLCIACSEDPTFVVKHENLSADDVIIPLADGNYWIYATSWMEDTIPRSLRNTITVVGTQPGLGETWYKYELSENWSEFSQSRTALLRNADSGVYMYVDTLGMEWRIYPYPAELNDSIYTVLRGDSISVKLVGIGELVTSPVGTFQCNTYRYSLPAEGGRRTNITEYFRPRMGLVRILTEVPIGDKDSIRVYSTDLIEYLVKE